VVFGKLGKFLLLGVDLGYCVGGFGWFWVVLGVLGNFPLWRVDLGHCVGGFGWFWGSKAIILHGELI
jgi:hypothetical protein